MPEHSENVVDETLLKKAEFRKLFGDCPAMYKRAAESDITDFLRKNGTGFHVFILPHTMPLTSGRFVPELLLKQPENAVLSARPGEFLVFQVIVWTPVYGLMGLSAVSEHSVPFVKPCNLRGGELKSFFMGLEIPQDASGMLTEELIVHTENDGDRTITASIRISGAVLADGGESDDNRMARLKWLHSSIGKEDTVFEPYIPLRREGRTVFYLDHELILAENGLPEHIFANGKDLLSAPVKFVCGNNTLEGRTEFTLEKNCRIEWCSAGRFGNQNAVLKGAVDFDGYLSFELKTDGCGEYRLEFACANHDYLVGLGRHGGSAPERMDWFWDPHACQDGCWLGNIESGVRLKLRDDKTVRPLTNCYYHFQEAVPPEAWNNDGKGGIRLTGNTLTAFSGLSSEKKTRVFGFDLQTTPFHKYNPEKQFRTRAWHPFVHSFPVGGPNPVENADLESLAKQGITRINVHHGMGLNPFINYPYTGLSLGRLNDFVRKAHSFGIEVNIYCTMRELSIHGAEFWAFHAMGNEIFLPGLGCEALPATSGTAQNPWFSEHVSIPFLPAWAETIKDGPAFNNIDLALETVPESPELENFYLEGFRYLLEHCPVDGFYLDDTSLSREGFMRLHRIFRKYRGKAPNLDFHAWNPFPFDPAERDFGRASVVLRDMHNLPFLTELWLGEAFDYEKASPDYYLTEISGLPFGLTSQMLQGGGNPYRGLLYGMTCRYGWVNSDPRELWKFFDEFGLDGLNFELDAPFPEELPGGIRTTRYTNRCGKVCYVLASWSDKAFELKGNFHVPEIPGFQRSGEKTVMPGKGLIVIPNGRKM